jgi:hypothetical protein
MLLACLVASVFDFVYEFVNLVHYFHLHGKCIR